MRDEAALTFRRPDYYNSDVSNELCYPVFKQNIGQNPKFFQILSKIKRKSPRYSIKFLKKKTVGETEILSNKKNTRDSRDSLMFLQIQTPDSHEIML